MTSRADSVAAMFVAAARDYPDRTFLRWCRGDERIAWSYAEAAVRIDALVARLDALGIAAGDHVVVHTAAMTPSILFDLACACAGVVFAPLETSSVPAVLELCARTGARAVLTTPDRAGAGSYGDLPSVAEDGRAAVTGDPSAAIARLAARAGRVDRETTYMLQPTSGTTGGSKLVIRPHAAFVRVARLLALGVDRASEPPARFLMVAALTHGMGQYLMAAAMSLAAELAVTSRIDVGADLEEIRGLDPTVLGLTPRVMRRLVQQLGGLPDGGRIFGPSARFMITGGAPPDPDILAAFERSGVSVVEVYGASEFSLVALTRPGQWRPGVVGHVLDDVTLRITDDGELHAWTPVLMRGYHAAPELTRAAFTEDGFYRSGDRVAIGPDGELRYQGRVVDSFNLFDGSHVAPGPIEEAMSRLPWIEQVMLLGDQRPFLTGLVVPHAALRGPSPSPALRRLIERDLGRICAEWDPNARVRRVAVLDRVLPEEVYQVVGHGKVRRLREPAIKLLAETVDALYTGSGPAPRGVTRIDIPGADAERRGCSRQRRSWLVRIETAGQTVLAYTRDVGRRGAFIEHDEAIAAVDVGSPGATMTVDVLDLDGRSLALDAELVRRTPSGTAIRWIGPADALADLAARLPP